jgi:hypothetical protein
MSARTMDEIGKGYLDALRAPPLVKRSGTFFLFYRNGAMVYDVHVSDPLDAIRLMGRLSERKWFTRRHLEQFTSLAEDQFGSGYR